jgi:hypothetical protein
MCAANARQLRTVLDGQINREMASMSADASRLQEVRENIHLGFVYNFILQNRLSVFRAPLLCRFHFKWVRECRMYCAISVCKLVTLHNRSYSRILPLQQHHRKCMIP